MGALKELLLLLVFITALGTSSASTNQQDVAALQALMNQMKNTPLGWGKSADPCGTPPWAGVNCSNSRVIGLKLFNMGLEGTLSSDIGSLTELQTLNLCYNKKLGGPLPSAIGNLKQLATLTLIGCSFNGSIPDELGNLSQLSYLALNSNHFTGRIPPILGSLSNLFWLDLAENKLTGPLPISTKTTPGLDQLVKAQHFHLNQNQLSGPVPEKLFNSNLILAHVLLDRNQFNGTIPDSIGLVKTLTVIRLDVNSLSGPVPSSINNLTHLSVLNLANNKLTGPMPNLTGMNFLNSLDLSNNSFYPSETPAWILEMENLTSLVIESGGLHGEVPQKLFSFPQLQQVILNNNLFNGTLDMGNNISKQLQTVNFQNNNLAAVALSSSYNNTIILVGNPVCSNVHLSLTSYCFIGQQSSAPYSTNLTDCDPQSCPQNYTCSHPYEGLMTFRAPFFQDVTNKTRFQLLEKAVWDSLVHTVGSLYIQNPYFDANSYLHVELKLCSLTGTYFNQSEILLEFDLSSQHIHPPDDFGPYYFNATPYLLQGKRSSISTGVIIGAVVGCVLLVLGLAGVGIYALRQKKRAQRANEIINPFAAWVPSIEDGEGSGGAPQLKGARWFSYDELKKCTNNFPEINEIGSGGYGKVYRGVLSDGQMVAIKRSQIGSNQGALEFKTEIELLSRVHHKNLLELVGFCFQQGERMVVYEYIPNGTLRESLSGKRGIELDWNRRLRIALGSARGIAYLHELANPAIIHRDIKSTNILLDEKLNAIVADFGLSKLVSDSDIDAPVKGTLGYLDPEYYTTQQLSEKSDVYSFGVVMLELVTSTSPIRNERYIVREVKMVIDKNDDKYFGLKEVMDPVIRDGQNLTGFRRFVELALQCVEDSSINRPTMSDIVREIETMLRSDDGVDTNSVSASSPDREFGSSYGAAPRYYPYNNDPMRGKVVGGNSFEYSGGYSFSGIQPK